MSKKRTQFISRKKTDVGSYNIDKVKKVKTLNNVKEAKKVCSICGSELRKTRKGDFDNLNEEELLLHRKMEDFNHQLHKGVINSSFFHACFPAFLRIINEERRFVQCSDCLNFKNGVCNGGVEPIECSLMKKINRGNDRKR